MLMRTREHSCKTTFAGGVNIFHASKSQLSEHRAPDKPKVVQSILRREELLEVLATGWHTLDALSKKVDLSTVACYERLKTLTKEGVVKRRQCVGTRANEYTLGRQSEVTLTMTERVLSLIRTEPFITARQISTKLGLGKTTNTLASLFAKGVITRRKSLLGVYVYYGVGGANAESNGRTSDPTRTPCYRAD